jgi:6,7-dimethyl-8-ribityllumazine synthase
MKDYKVAPKIAIVQATWNSDITGMLAESCEKRLKQDGVEVRKYLVPGAVELAVMAKNIIEKTPEVKAVICIGAVIKGETDHYEHVASQAAYGIQSVSITTGTPVIFGVLTTQTKEQALARANGTHSYSGVEWAETAMVMIKNIESL